MNETDSTSIGFTPARLAVLLVLWVTIAPLTAVALQAVGLSNIGAAAGTTLTVAIVTAGAVRSRFRRLRIERRDRVLFVVWLALSLWAGYKLAGLSVFMHDVTRTEFAMDPPVRALNDEKLTKPFFPKHNCFTCYLVAARLADLGVHNLYDPGHYRNPDKETDIHRQIGENLHVDRYQYPPPFLLLPRLLLATGLGFYPIRAIWFALNVAVFLATVVALATRLDGAKFGVAWLAWPIVLAAPTARSSLQIGNVHFLIVCLSVLGMLCLETKRRRIGGLLLGFAIVSKIFPGILLVYLAGRKRWRDLAWTVGAMGALTAAAWLVFGNRPFEAFINYQLPRIANGDAFSFAREHIRAMALNLSVLGVPFKLAKLQWLGDADPVRVSAILGWCYTGGLLVLTWFVGRRTTRSSHAAFMSPKKANDGYGLAQVWLALLILGQLRSPFLPWGYGGTAVLWLVAMLLPHHGDRAYRLLWLVPMCLIFAEHVPLRFGPATVAFDLIYTLIALLAALAVCLLVLLRRRPSVPALETLRADHGG